MFSIKPSCAPWITVSFKGCEIERPLISLVSIQKQVSIVSTNKAQKPPLTFENISENLFSFWIEFCGIRLSKIKSSKLNFLTRLTEIPLLIAVVVDSYGFIDIEFFSRRGSKIKSLIESLSTIPSTKRIKAE